MTETEKSLGQDPQAGTPEKTNPPTAPVDAKASLTQPTISPESAAPQMDYQALADKLGVTPDIIRQVIDRDHTGLSNDEIMRISKGIAENAPTTVQAEDEGFGRATRDLRAERFFNEQRGKEQTIAGLVEELAIPEEELSKFLDSVHVDLSRNTADTETLAKITAWKEKLARTRAIELLALRVPANTPEIQLIRSLYFNGVAELDTYEDEEIKEKNNAALTESAEPSDDLGTPSEEDEATFTVGIPGNARYDLSYSLNSGLEGKTFLITEVASKVEAEVLDIIPELLSRYPDSFPVETEHERVRLWNAAMNIYKAINYSKLIERNAFSRNEQGSVFLEVSSLADQMLSVDREMNLPSNDEFGIFESYVRNTPSFTEKDIKSLAAAITGTKISLGEKSEFIARWGAQPEQAIRDKKPLIRETERVPR